MILARSSDSLGSIFIRSKFYLVPSSQLFLFCMDILQHQIKAPWFRVLNALAEALGLVPSTHFRWLTTICNSSSWGSCPPFGPL